VTRRSRRALFVALILLSHELAAYGLAAWDAGDRVLGGGAARILAVALLLAFFALRFVSVVVVPALLTWWTLAFAWRLAERRR